MTKVSVWKEFVQKFKKENNFKIIVDGSAVKKASYGLNI